MNSDKELATQSLPQAVKKISKVAAQGVIHQNKASRLIQDLQNVSIPSNFDISARQLAIK